MQRTNHSSEPAVGLVWQELRNRWLYASIIAFVLFSNVGIIYWNENRDVNVLRSLSEGLHNVKTLQNADVSLKENDHKLVHLYGKLSTNRLLSAPDYRVSIRAVKLQRHVEMYQWVEKRSTMEDDNDDDDEDDETTSYSYYKAWSSEVILSNRFYLGKTYANPTVMPITDNLEVVDIVKVGCFVLSQGLIDRIDQYRPFTGHIRPVDSDIKLHAGWYYHTDNVWSPKIGDIKIEFSHAGLAGEQAETVTIIAKQEGQMLVPFVTDSGEQISIIHLGRKSPEEIFYREKPRNPWQTWGWRATTYFGLFLAINGVVHLIDTIGSESPVIRNLLGMGTTFVNVSLTLAIFMFAMAVSWVRYKLLFGFGFLVLSILPIALATFKFYTFKNIENKLYRQR